MGILGNATIHILIDCVGTAQMDNSGPNPIQLSRSNVVTLQPWIKEEKLFYLEEGFMTTSPTQEKVLHIPLAWLHQQ